MVLLHRIQLLKWFPSHRLKWFPSHYLTLHVKADDFLVPAPSDPNSPRWGYRKKILNDLACSLYCVMEYNLSIWKYINFYILVESFRLVNKIRNLRLLIFKLELFLIVFCWSERNSHSAGFPNWGLNFPKNLSKEIISRLNKHVPILLKKIRWKVSKPGLHIYGVLLFAVLKGVV